jgi:hypothetical protein
MTLHRPQNNRYDEVKLVLFCDDHRLIQWHTEVRPSPIGCNLTQYGRVTCALKSSENILNPYCKGKGKVTPKQAYVALRGPGG